MYKIYHIPGKKIGVTRNLNKRVTVQQGYAPDEYEVLLTSDDIDYVSAMELELQKSYGYKVDRQSYTNLINKNKQMKINATEQTSTFPCPLDKLKGRLMDNLDLSWKTSNGKFEITKENIPWIMANARTSMFNDNRSYIYNKAFYEAFFNQEHTPVTIEDLGKLRSSYQDNRFDLIRNWARVRGIYDDGNDMVQYVKLQEEAGELAQAILKDDQAEVIDAIGDMIVVLTNLAELRGVRVEECIDSAYNEIANRKGEMKNGTFVKETL